MSLTSERNEERIPDHQPALLLRNAFGEPTTNLPHGGADPPLLVAQLLRQRSDDQAKRLVELLAPQLGQREHHAAGGEATPISKTQQNELCENRDSEILNTVWALTLTFFCRK